MAIRGIVDLFLGSKAEGRELEQIAEPLTAQRSSSSPGMSVSALTAVVGLDREVEAIARAIADHARPSGASWRGWSARGSGPGPLRGGVGRRRAGRRRAAGFAGAVWRAGINPGWVGERGHPPRRSSVGPVRKSSAQLTTIIVVNCSRDQR
jgi:hypothetical protein